MILMATTPWHARTMYVNDEDRSKILQETQQIFTQYLHKKSQTFEQVVESLSIR